MLTSPTCPNQGFAKWLGAGCAVVLLALAGSGCRQVPEVPPNLILVTIDTLRADRVGAYGNEDGLTPHLDALAAEGTVFERALAPITTTHPSHATMLTGFYSRSHGVLWNGHGLASENITLAERLQEVGYSTGAFVSYPAMLYRAKLNQGFEAVSDTHRRAGTKYYRACPKTNAMAIEWLRSQPGSPLFLWVHYFEPHTPYPLQPYAARKLAEAGYDGPLARGTEHLKAAVRAAANAKAKESPREREAIRMLYDGEVEAADRCLGELLEELESHGLLEPSVVVAAADHGEGLGEHGRWNHGPVLWNSVLRVPMILRDSRRTQARRVRQRVGLVDLTPTLLELLGLEVPAGLQGRSLVPGLDGRKLAARPYFAEAWPNHQYADGRRSSDDFQENFENRLAVYLNQFKRTTFKGQHRLFNISKDPEEIAPLQRRKFKSVADELAELADEFLAMEVGAAGNDLLDAEDLEELRSLGYL